VRRRGGGGGGGGAATRYGRGSPRGAAAAARPRAVAGGRPVLHLVLRCHTIEVHAAQPLREVATHVL
jgi:hypothetical protein